jgi:hypothetical protein
LRFFKRFHVSGFVGKQLLQEIKKQQSQQQQLQQQQLHQQLQQQRLRLL